VATAISPPRSRHACALSCFVAAWQSSAGGFCFGAPPRSVASCSARCRMTSHSEEKSVGGRRKRRCRKPHRQSSDTSLGGSCGASEGRAQRAARLCPPGQRDERSRPGLAPSAHRAGGAPFARFGGEATVWFGLLLDRGVAAPRAGWAGRRTTPFATRYGVERLTEGNLGVACHPTRVQGGVLSTPPQPGGPKLDFKVRLSDGALL